MQPFDYRIAVQDPLQMALAGYQQGQQFQNQRVQAERETQLYDMEMQQYQANQAKLQEEQARAQAMQADFADFAEGLSSGTRTIDDVIRLSGLYPEIAEQVQSTYQMKTDVQKNNEIKESLALASLFRNAPDAGAAKLAEKIAAAEAAGDMERLAGLKSIEASIGVSPDAPVAAAIFTLFNVMPADQFKLVAEQLGLAPEKVPDSFRALELRAEQAGLVPGTAEHQEFMKQGGAERGPAVQVVMPAEATSFDRRLGEGQADQVLAISSEGAKARRNRNTLFQLQDMLAETPAGAEAGIKSFAGNFGIDTEGLGEIQALEALISQLVPTQRLPGSGPMSDADLALYKKSLPRIINQRGGNEKIIETTLALNNYLIEEAKIADKVINREITPAEGRNEMAALINPLAEFSAGGGATGARQSGPPIGTVEDGFAFQGGDPADPNNWKLQ